jgi:hypothetical protein
VRARRKKPMSPGFQKPSVAGKTGRLGKVVEAPKAKKPRVKGAKKVAVHKPGKPNMDAFRLKWSGGHAKGKTRHKRIG